MKLDINDPSTFTAQRIFDFVVINLAEQGTKSIVGVSCQYRGLENRKCAAGFLIPDAVYNHRMEGTTIPTVIDAYLPDLKSYKDLIELLQVAHDRVYSLSAFRAKLRTVASTFNLNPAMVSFVATWEIL